MQLVKYFLRSFGNKNPEYEVISAQEVEEELRVKYLSNGWTVQSTEYLGAMKDRNGNEIGYRIFHVLVKAEEDKPVSVREPLKKDK